MNVANPLRHYTNNLQARVFPLCVMGPTDNPTYAMVKLSQYREVRVWEIGEPLDGVFPNNEVRIVKPKSYWELATPVHLRVFYNNNVLMMVML